MSLELPASKFGRSVGRGGFIDIVDVNHRFLVKPAPTGITIYLPDTRGGFIDIVDVNHRFLVKPAPTGITYYLRPEG
jgi:hypothetical protein